MKVKFLDMEDDSDSLNAKRVVDPRELAATLDQLRYGEPFGVKRNSENGATLDVCLAETCGSPPYTTPDDAYLLATKSGTVPVPLYGGVNSHAPALQADEKAGMESPEFLIGGTATPIPIRSILSCEMVRRIAVYFVATGEREQSVEWEFI